MLQLIALLTLLVPIPVWALMIFRPHDERTRNLTAHYTIFIPLGILYVFLLVGTLASGFGLRDLVSGALNTTTTGSDLSGALTDALNKVQALMPTLALAVLAGGGVMDLVGGHYMYHDMQKRGVSDLENGVFLVLTYLTGAFGLFVFLFWRYLSTTRQSQTTASNATAPSTSAGT